VIEAEIELATSRDHLAVCSIDREGHLTGKVPSKLADGVLKFELGGTFPSMYYLIQKL